MRRKGSRVSCNKVFFLDTEFLPAEFDLRNQILPKSVAYGQELLPPKYDHLYPGALRQTRVRMRLDGGLPGHGRSHHQIAARAPTDVSKIAAASLPTPRPLPPPDEPENRSESCRKQAPVRLERAPPFTFQLRRAGRRLMIAAFHKKLRPHFIRFRPRRLGSRTWNRERKPRCGVMMGNFPL